MNQLFRRPGQQAIRPDEPISRGHIDWDLRVSEAIASKTAWKQAAFLSLAVLAGSVAGNVYLAQQSKIQTIHIVHDSIGGVIAVSASSDPSGGPTQAMLMAAIQEWVVDVRTVYIDVLALRRSILAAYALVADKSQAANALNAFYQTKDPFQRAEDETVSLQNVVAVPPTSSDIGAGGQQTWALSWIEIVMSRDGTNVSSTRWAGNVTLKIDTPKTVADATRNPNGVHVISFSWTGGAK
jgi:type IV secretory pathway TrbF-like protein